MGNTGQATSVVTESELARILDALADRRMNDLFDACDQVVSRVGTLNIEDISVQRATGRIWLAISAGYERVAEGEFLLDRYHNLTLVWLPAATQCCVRLARAVREQRRGDFVSAAKHYQQLLDSENLEDLTITTMVQYLLAQCWQKLGQYDLATSYANEALERATNAGLTQMAAVILMLLAWIEFQRCSYAESRRLLDRVEAGLSGTDDLSSLSHLAYIKARRERRLGNRSGALDHYTRAISIARQAKWCRRNEIRATVQKAFEQRLKALEMEQDYDRRRGEGRRGEVEKTFRELNVESHRFISELARFDALVAVDVSDPTVKRFLNKVSRAYAQSLVEQEHARERIATIAEIKRLRASAREALQELSAGGSDPFSLRGRPSLSCIRAQLELDEGSLDLAAAAAEEARATAEGDKIAMARALLVSCMIEHEKAEQGDRTQQVRHAQAALVRATEAQGLLEDTQHRRLQGKVAVWLGLSHLRVGDFDEARRLEAVAKKALRLARNDYVQRDLRRLRKGLSSEATAVSSIEDLVTKALGGASMSTLRVLFEMVVILAAFRSTGSITATAAMLGINRDKVRRRLKEAGERV